MYYPSMFCFIFSTHLLSLCALMTFLFLYISPQLTGDPLHSRALAHSRAPLFTQPCPHCSHSRAQGEQWARLCVFTLQGCVQAARLCRGSPVQLYILDCGPYIMYQELKTFCYVSTQTSISMYCISTDFLRWITVLSVTKKSYSMIRLYIALVAASISIEIAVVN